MSQKTASRTALATAHVRAAHQLLDPPPRILEEDRLAAAVGRGVEQYVILGAGFDTFAMRQPTWAQQLRILEVDHAGTQEL